MTNDEKIQYLANIWYLALVDGKAERIEDKILDVIARGIDAGYFETIKAKGRATQEGFTLQYPARLSDRIRNVEDILLMAYADKKLESLEKKILIDYANHLDITKEQLAAIQQETKARLKDIRIL
jgi:uncharacterized tellurite resistance protein B-like protein